MHLQQRINAFVKLGSFLGQFSASGIENNINSSQNDVFFEGFQHQIKLAHEHNGWFTKDNIIFALNGWSKQLTKNAINTWLSN